MQQTLPRLLFAVCALAVLASIVNATITLECDNGETCEGPLSMDFGTANCSGTANASPMISDVTTFPNVSAGVCFSYSSYSSSYTCDNGSLRLKTWLTNTNCGGEAGYETYFVANTCLLKPGNGMPVSFMYVCKPEDVNATIIPPADVTSSPNDPFIVDEGPCPYGLCPVGFASQTVYNESGTCTGPYETRTAGIGQVGVCYRVSSYASMMTTCDQNLLRSTTYAGTCADAVILKSDVFRPTTCALFETDSASTSREIQCPTLTPQPSVGPAPTPTAAPTLAPTPHGQASSLSLPLLLAFMLLAFTSFISF